MKTPLQPIRILILLFGWVLCAGLSAAESRRPNIILFLIDDQDKSSIGAYGGKTYTPALDQMAAEGIRFNRAYVSSAVCTPSRYAFITGRYAGNSTSKPLPDPIPLKIQFPFSFSNSEK